MDPKEELQPVLKLLSALIFLGAGIVGLTRGRVMQGRLGEVWFEGPPATLFASLVTLIGAGILLSWLADRGWLPRRRE